MARPGKPRQRSHRPQASYGMREPRQPRFHIAWAYDQLESPPEPADRAAFSWALTKARSYDRGHEHEYPEGNGFFDRDTLLQLAYENVRDLMLAYRKVAA